MSTEIEFTAEVMATAGRIADLDALEAIEGPPNPLSRLVGKGDRMTVDGQLDQLAVLAGRIIRDYKQDRQAAIDWFYKVMVWSANRE